jgi:hypothetical protein
MVIIVPVIQQILQAVLFDSVGNTASLILFQCVFMADGLILGCLLENRLKLRVGLSLRQERLSGNYFIVA